MEVKSISKDYYYEHVQELVEECLGKTYSENVVSLDEDDKVLLVVEENDKTIAFACGYNSETPEDYIDYLNKDLGANSILEKVVVDSEHRGKGLGTMLLKERLKRLEQPTIVEAWIRSDSPDSTSLLEKNGFEIVEKFENRWYEESKKAKDENFCPDCGQICECDSAVYIYKNN